MEHNTEHLSAEEAANKARGYKAAMHNPNVSEQGKKHAEQALHELESTGQTQKLHGQSGGGGGGGGHHQGHESHKQQTHEDNVARGLKAATHNPRVSQHAKEEAEEKLERMGRE
ncbi:hypothetical protein PRK78_004395 [Emydomyces testavorans]|uniref:Conidiation-specific protein 6 n=1 Tax=Emydomyces testavorans TaxID=2070801 RepID=A0AAF0DJU4_9EURO|nr:hypothetical protein PRK78_004395 [Emydomyces testavorans]